MKDIIENSSLFTHGGRLGALYGILSSNKLSSNNALERAGDSVYKFTDPNNEFKDEDGYIFFESVADRGRVNYASFIEQGRDQVGFAFLLVASSDSLLKQVDMLGNSDGILMGRSDGEPLEIDLKQVNYKILVPDSYKEMISAYCDKLKSLGINPPEHTLMFKPMNELQEIVAYKGYENALERQNELSQTIGLETKISEKSFSFSKKIIATKTSNIEVMCDSPLLKLSEEEKKIYPFNNAQDLVNHMRSRPTDSNIQRNTMSLFLESHNSQLRKKIGEISNNRPMILDLMNKPEDLAFCLNNLAQFHPSRQRQENGEYRVERYSLSSLKSKLRDTNEESYIVEGLIECIESVVYKNITKEECVSILEKHKNKIPDPIEQSWAIAINRQPQQLYVNESQVKEIIKNNIGQEILLWQPGMTEWKNAFTIPEFMPQSPPLPVMPPPLPEVVKNMKEIRENLKQEDLGNKLKNKI